MCLFVKEGMGNAQYLSRYGSAAHETSVPGPLEALVPCHDRTSRTSVLYHNVRASEWET